VERKVVIAIAAGLMLGCLAAGQNPPEKKPAAHAVQPASQLADSLAQRLSNEMHVKTAVGEPVRVGSVTLIPIIMIDVSFGGGGVADPGKPAAGASQNAEMGGATFFMSGEARPLGFVVITRKGTRFLSVAQPAK
jgi:uncharacterized spore protein YtfJ